MENLEFKVSAGLKDIIGRELITNDSIAIFELVKNSYDANAKTVKIVFLNTKSDPKNAKILIIDDGVGMSLKDIREKWLTVGYSYRNIETPKNKHRIFAGAKGIGRFSCDRLGRRLNMYTKTSSDKKINFITVDWDKFTKDPSSEFEKIHVDYLEKNVIEIAEYNKNNLDHGTVLEISNLRRLWTAEELRKLKSYLQRLVNPSNSNNDFKIYLEAGEYLKEDEKSRKKKKEFDVINGRVENMLFEKLEIKTIHIYSSIKDGKIHIVLSDGDGYIFKLEEDNKKYPHISNIKVNLFYLDKNAKSIFKRIMGIHVKDYGSIFLYKNDFRVQRYGNPNNDWLGLDTRKAQGMKRNLGTRELLGRVEILGDNAILSEVSSREALNENNKEFSELKEYLIDTVKILEKYLIEGLSWKTPDLAKPETEINMDIISSVAKIIGTNNQGHKLDVNTDLIKKIELPANKTVPELLKSMEIIKGALKSEEQKTFFEHQLKRLKESVHNIQEFAETKQKEAFFLEKAIPQDKDVVINLQHSINIHTQIIGILLEKMNEILRKTPNNELTEIADKIQLENEKIRKLASYFGSATFNIAKSKLTDTDIISFITGYINSVVKETYPIDFEFAEANSVFATSFDPLTLSVIIDNFVSNSYKKDATKMKISFEPSGKGLKIYFYDDGDGVKQKDVRFLFTRGFTTTGGSGLGLYFIKRLANSQNWNVEFTGNGIDKSMKGACFVVTVNG